MPRTSTTWTKGVHGNPGGKSSEQRRAEDEWKKWARNKCMKKRGKLAKMADENPSVMMWLHEQAFGKPMAANHEEMAKQMAWGMFMEFGVALSNLMTEEERQRFLELNSKLTLGGKVAADIISEAGEEHRGLDAGVSKLPDGRGGPDNSGESSSRDDKAG